MSEAATDTAPAQTADTAPGENKSSSSQNNNQQQNQNQNQQQPDNKGGGNDQKKNDPPAFILPDAHKEKSWASKIKSQDDVYAQLDNLTALVGKKVIQPIDFEKATPEEIAAHYKKLAPEDVAAYNFGEKADPEFAKAVAPIFQELGINPHQAKGLSEKITEIAAKMVQAQKAADTSEEGYFKLMEGSFGEKSKAIAGFVENNLKQYASAEDKAVFDSVDNATRVAIDRTIFNVLKAHGVTESGAQTGGDKGAPQGGDVETTRKNLRQQIAELGRKPHTAEQKQKLVDDLAATYKTK